MEERQVSVEGQARPLPDPFMVVATQNPVEYEGTYPLPEAQLDRFLLKLLVPYPDAVEEQAVVARIDQGLDARRLEASGLRAVMGVAELAAAQAEIAALRVDPVIHAYVVALARATRDLPTVALGVSPRGASMLLRAAKAWAWLRGREFVTPDEVQAMVKAVFRHRVALEAEAELEGVRVDQVIDRVLASVPVAPLMAAPTATAPERDPAEPGSEPPSGGPTAAAGAGDTTSSGRPTGYRRWRPVPTGRAALAVLAASVVQLAVPVAAPWGLVTTLAVVVVLAGADLVLAANPRRIDVRRRLPSVVQLRSSAEVSWSVHHPGPRAARLAVADELAPSLGAGSRRFRLVAQPGRTHHLSTTVRPTPTGPVRALRAGGARVGAAGSDGPPGGADDTPGAAGVPPVRASPARPGDRPDPAGGAWATGVTGWPGVEPTSTSCASTTSTTTPGASTGRPPPVAPGRSCGRTGWSATRPSSSCSTTAASWPGGSPACPGPSTPWTRCSCSPRPPAASGTGWA